MQLNFDSENGICSLDAAGLLAAAGPGEIVQLRRFLLHPDLKGVVIRFSAPREQSARVTTTLQPLWQLLACATVPTVAAIQGPCQYAEAELALACHFRIAADDASFGFENPCSSRLATLAQQNSLRRALVDLIVSERAVSAEEALATGLVDRVVPAAELEEAALRYLSSLVGNRPACVIRAAMESIRNAWQLPREEALRKEAALFLKVAREAFEIGEAEAL